MPIYEYECKKCKKYFEVWQKITEEPLKICKECGGELLKLISESNFILKGTGWYVTDYAKKEKDKKDKNSKEKDKDIASEKA